MKLIRASFLAFVLFSASHAYDIFEGSYPRFRCCPGRNLTGCNETLLEAYNKTNLTASDQNINPAETWVMLYTRKNPNNPEYLDQCACYLPLNTNFNASNNIVIIIHGFLEGVCLEAWQREMKDQYMCRGEFNVILIDYSWGSGPDYAGAVRDSVVVCKQIALCIQNLIKSNSNITLQKIHIIGHSLGAQIAGCIGQYVQILLGGKVRRITGLDPAGPGYQDNHPDERLDSSDAKLVDCIRTNVGTCVLWAFGYYGPIGHADFYVNGGQVQESCYSYIIPSFLKGDVSYAALSLFPPACYHKQSVQYYKVSINPCKCQFIGAICAYYQGNTLAIGASCGADGTRCAVMGMDYEIYPGPAGTYSYCVNTGPCCPYCDNFGINTTGFQTSPGPCCNMSAPTQKLIG